MNNGKKIPESDRTTEQEIRRSRKFSLAEAVGREAAGALKGASPVAAAERLLLDIEHLLDNHLPDAEGSLRRTLLARLQDNTPLLGRHLDDPAAALRTIVTRLLDSVSAMDQIVRDTDARWGRDYGERPRFNRPDQADHPDDPYTPDSVRAALQTLLQQLG